MCIPYLKKICKIMMLVLLLILPLMLAGCPGLSDWAYDKLPGKYAIWRINSQDIQLVKEDASSGEPIVGRYIIAFCYDDRYIGVQRVPLEQEYDEVVDIETIDTSNPEFYLVDTETDSIYGPWTYTEYSNGIINFGVTGMCEWIYTSLTPKGAEQILLVNAWS